MAIRLQERDRRVLAHVRRYRLTTPTVLAKRFFGGAEQAMKSTVKRLIGKGGLLASERLYPRGNDVYYYLTPAGAVAAGLSEKSGHSMTNPDDLARLFGQLVFCSGDPVKREKLSLEEFENVFPALMSEAFRRRFAFDCVYVDVDTTGERRLGRVVVETGGSEIIFRARKCLREDTEVLERFVAEGRYALGLVVATASKAKQVERQLQGAPLLDPRGAPVRVVVEAHEALQGLVLGGGSG